MIFVKSEPYSEAVRQEAGHTLFVEGEGDGSFDFAIIKFIFKNRSIAIKALGGSYSIKSVAEALHKYHPTYYFLIDRDHHCDEFVESCWQNFPDVSKHNLLIWRKKEIENYFLDPVYLKKSSYCVADINELKKKILNFSQKRLFFDCVNHVIISIREELKKNWIEKFSNLSDFPNMKISLRRLLKIDNFLEHSNAINEKTSVAALEKHFKEIFEKMTGGENELKLGVGEWLNMIQGKKILSQIINSNCFKVIGMDKKPLKGQQKINEVVKNLLKEHADHMPQDFIDLKKLIDKKIIKG